MDVVILVTDISINEVILYNLHNNYLMKWIFLSKLEVIKFEILKQKIVRGLYHNFLSIKTRMTTSIIMLHNKTHWNHSLCQSIKHLYSVTLLGKFDNLCCSSSIINAALLVIKLNNKWKIIFLAAIWPDLRKFL